METSEFIKKVIEHSTEKIYSINQAGLITAAAHQSNYNLIGKSITLVPKIHVLYYDWKDDK